VSGRTHCVRYVEGALRPIAGGAVTERVNDFETESGLS